MPVRAEGVSLGTLQSGCYLLLADAGETAPMLAGPAQDEASCMAFVLHAGRNAHLLMLEQAMPSAALFAASGARSARMPREIRLAKLARPLAEVLCGLRSDYADECSASFRPGRLRQLLPDAPPADVMPGSEWPACFPRLWTLGLEAATPHSAFMQVATAAPGAAVRHDRTGAHIGVHLHLYYHDLWEEISAQLEHLPQGFGLHVTTHAAHPALFERITARFPGASITLAQNRGRDIAPFLALLGAGAFDRYAYVCKIHSKKSPLSDGRESYVGRAWRRRALHDLLGSAAQVGRIVALFEDDPRTGVAGSARLRRPNPRINARQAIGANRRMVEALLARCAGKPTSAAVDFFAGSMFWFRPAALRPVRALGVRPEDFPTPCERNDGMLDHALERVIPTAAALCGYRVQNVPEH